MLSSFDEKALARAAGKSHTRAGNILDLNHIELRIASPHTVDNVQPLSHLACGPVGLAFIGTCTNGCYEDLATAAEILQDHRVHPDTRMKSKINLENRLIHLPAGTFPFASFPPNMRAILDAGGLIPYLQSSS